MDSTPTDTEATRTRTARPETARWPESWRRRIAADIEAAGGRHDEPEIYSGEPGDPGLAGGPDSMSWEIHGDLASVVVAGTGAILMEVLHPSVMAGVFTQSSYRTDPLRRARSTLGYVLRTTFGSTPGASRVIDIVKRIHARIEGTRPDGVAYRALDPELIAWVHTCIPWAVMTAYDRYRRPLSVEEKNRYLREQAVIGRMGGADWVPETVSDLEDYVERMRPLMGMNEQTRSFLDFVAGTSGDFPVSRREQVDRWIAIRASMSLMPEWAQRLTGTHLLGPLQRWWLAPADRLKTKLVRWAYPELPCKAMALARARGGSRRSASRAPRDARRVRSRGRPSAGTPAGARRVFGDDPVVAVVVEPALQPMQEAVELADLVARPAAEVAALVGREAPDHRVAQSHARGRHAQPADARVRTSCVTTPHHTRISSSSGRFGRTD